MPAQEESWNVSVSNFKQELEVEHGIRLHESPEKATGIKWGRLWTKEGYKEKPQLDSPDDESAPGDEILANDSSNLENADGNEAEAQRQNIPIQSNIKTSYTSSGAYNQKVDGSNLPDAYHFGRRPASLIPPEISINKK